MGNKGDTSARYIHALLAAAVADPKVLRRLRGQGRARKAHAAGAFDLDRLQLFTGLAVKVRQNDVRLSLPLTFKLLDKLKISLPLFAAYGKKIGGLGRAKKLTRADKIEAISGFIETWLDPRNPAHALVRDILHHERTVDALNKGEAGDLRRHRKTKAKVTPLSVPRQAANVTCHEMSCDPVALARLLRSPNGDLSALPRGQFYYVYGWDSHDGCVTAKELDEFGNTMLTLADGRHSVAQLTDALHKAGVVLTPEHTRRAVQDLVDVGLLILQV